jgi:putative ABC transport system permease protein
MKHNLLSSAFRSLRYSVKDSVYQVVTVTLLSAIITGSLFTGYSVRNSLKRTSTEKLGNTDIIVSSGLRYFDASLSQRIESVTGEKAVSLLESDGYCQNFSSGSTALNIKIFGIGKDFFLFNGNDTLSVKTGYVAINSKLAYQLGINPGDEIIVHFRQVDPIPSNAPFSPSKNSNISRVMIVERILDSSESGNFSTGVSQVVPMNIFMNARDSQESILTRVRANRILIRNSKNRALREFQAIVSGVLEPSDIGLTLRKSEKTGETEMISDRIFIDSTVVSQVRKSIPSVSPVITYLANSLTIDGKSAPYSFVAGLPPSILPDLCDNCIIINKWLADDIGGKNDDTLTLRWFTTSSGNLLREKTGKFVIQRVIENDSKWSDPSLMPDFPGISGSTTCSGWDAGVPILLDRIRKKDEAYWNEFRGTPKAFICYKTGKEIWGNNYGPATALRFPSGMLAEDITKKLKGTFDAAKSGFTISDARRSSEKAANEGVDFSTLFLGLGIFIIVACLILLVLSMEMFFNARKKQVRTLYCLGYRNGYIRRQLFVESAFLSSAGALAGAFVGYFINMIIISQLNSVWTGAVQTDTLSADFSILPVIIGFLTTLFIASFVIVIKTGKFLKGLSEPLTGASGIPSVRRNLLFLALTGVTALITILLSFFIEKHSIILAFMGGSLLFVALVLLLRFLLVKRGNTKDSSHPDLRNLVDKYFSFHPGEAITPVILIAAGIFAVIITGANKQVVGPEDLLVSGGTGGYILFAESALPVREDLNSMDGKKEFGLDEPEFSDIIIEQAGRLSGDDASCLNLNHVSTPPILGIDQEHLIKRGSFSFASHIKKCRGKNPWDLLAETPGLNTIYGIADQSVLEWGLKLRTGDTLKYKSETGEDLNIVIGAGLKPSVFQGYLIISKKNLEKYFPTIAGGSIFLIDGNLKLSKEYKDTLTDRLSAYGFSVIDSGEKLSSFFQVTNTYLDVFTILGVFGIVLGTSGLGFVLLRNFNRRKNEFALMLAAGYSLKKIRVIVFRDNIIILVWGLATGIFSALSATLPSLNSGNKMPWASLAFLIIALIISGTTALLLAINSISNRSLVTYLRVE